LSKPSVFITRAQNEPAATVLEKEFTVEIWPLNSPPPRHVMETAVQSHSALLTEAGDRIDAALIGKAKGLKVIANKAIGTDNVDIAAASRNGIRVSNTPGLLEETCADMAFALMLNVSCKVSFADRMVRAGLWTSFDITPYLGVDVHHKTIGIVGMGGIAKGVARRARGFSMQVLYWSRTRRPEAERELGLEWTPTLDSLLECSDFVSLHVPLTAETRGLIGLPQFERMRSTAVLVNTARGAVVDHAALYSALSARMIAGAGIDVVDPEPLPKDSPLLELPNIVITPHIGTASRATFETMIMLAAANISAALSGKPMPSCVNPEAR